MSAAEDDLVIQLTPELRRYVTDPPSGSATGRAKAFGYDVVALAIRMATTTPLQRLQQMQRFVEAARILRRSNS
jgi:hypothetical protein